MRQRLAFVERTVLRIHWGFLTEQCLHSQGFFCFTHCCQWTGWGCTRNWEGMQPGQLTLADQGATPYCTVSCPVTKVSDKIEEERDVENWDAPLPKQSNNYIWWSLFFLEMAEHLSARGEWWMNSFFGFEALHSFRFFLLHRLYFNPWIFMLFLFPPHPIMGQWANGSVELNCLNWSLT